MGVRYVKTKFGTIFTRLLGSGVALNPLEIEVMHRLFDGLPLPIRAPAIEQLELYNLVQREYDGRALNFYRKVNGKVSLADLPKLPIRPGEVVLLRMAFLLEGGGERFHATMTAVNQRFFCMSFGSDTRPLVNRHIASVERVVDSWRSSLEVSAQQRAHE